MQLIEAFMPERFPVIRMSLAPFTKSAAERRSRGPAAKRKGKTNRLHVGRRVRRKHRRAA